MKGISARPFNGHSINRKESEDLSRTEYFVETDFGDSLLAIEIQTHSCSVRKRSRKHLEDELNCNLCTLARATRGKDLHLMNIKRLWNLHGGKRCYGANVKRRNLEVKPVVYQ
jgi:hypothetical protein